MSHSFSHIARVNFLVGYPHTSKPIRLFQPFTNKLRLRQENAASSVN
jgi:hypothetical protein